MSRSCAFDPVFNGRTFSELLASTPPPFQLPNLAASAAFLVQMKMSAARKSGARRGSTFSLVLAGEGNAPQEAHSCVGTGLDPERFHIFATIGANNGPRTRQRCRR